MNPSRPPQSPSAGLASTMRQLLQRTTGSTLSTSVSRRSELVLPRGCSHTTLNQPRNFKRCEAGFCAVVFPASCD